MSDIAKLTVGQRLWYKNKDTDLVGYVLVKRVYGEFFIYQLDGTEHRGSYDWIGTRLYSSLFDIPLSEQVNEKVRKNIRKSKPLPNFKYKSGYNFRVVDTDRPLLYRTSKGPGEQVSGSSKSAIEHPVKRTASCEICALRKNGTCSSLSNQLCEDYRPTQCISKEEMESYPEYGLATSIRLRGKK